MGIVETVQFFTFPSSKMRNLAKPNSRYANVFQMDFGTFEKSTHIISDWDQVWVPHHEYPKQATIAKLEEAVANCASVSILSNCSREREIEMKEALATTGVRFYRAEPKKPDPDAFSRIFHDLKLSPFDAEHLTVYIGDRIFTDVYGARKARIGTVIKVAPLSVYEPLGVRLARNAETFLYGSTSLHQVKL